MDGIVTCVTVFGTIRLFSELAGDWHD